LAETPEAEQVAELLARAVAAMQRLRSQGWTQQDFARALKELLEGKTKP